MIGTLNLILIRWRNNYEVWLYDRMIAQTLVYDLAYEIFKGMCKKHRTTPCWVVHIESGEIIDKFNFD